MCGSARSNDRRRRRVCRGAVCRRRSRSERMITTRRQFWRASASTAPNSKDLRQRTQSSSEASTGEDARMGNEKSVIRETDAEAIRLARTLIRTARYGALAALEPGSGAPLASRVAVAADLDGTPLILVSKLSEHTGAILADPRCSLLLGEPGKGDPLAHPRISLRCRAVRIERDAPDHPRIERRYLNRHPKAKLYAGFADFGFFRLVVERASLNGGFGRAYQLSG